MHRQLQARKKKQHKKNNTLDKIKTIDTPNTVLSLPESFPAPKIDNKEEEKIKTNKVNRSKIDKIEHKHEQNLIKRMRYTPIPIIYDSPLNEIRGKKVYRGLQPRTSDNYFRLLKDIDWKSPLNDKKVLRAGL